MDILCHGPWGWMGFGWLFWVIVIFLVIWAINNANRRRWYHQGPFLPQETAMDILKKRYAKGEISKEDFDRMKKDLES